MTTVAVCVLTYLRPVGLARVLHAIGEQDVDDDVDVRVVVVDNDPPGTARPVVEEVRPTLAWPLEYTVEARRGIPYARNTAVRTAGVADFLAFVDDDEEPSPGWLAALLQVQRTTGADVVMGPVVPRFEVPPPAWVQRGRFFERPRFRTGQRLHFGTTSNVLVASRVFPTDRPPFEERLGLNGGDDTHFFLRARLAGHVIVWSEEAEVTEWVPTSRTTLRWILARQYRRGNTLSLCLVDLQGTPGRRVKRFLGGVARIVEGLVLAVVTLPVDRVLAVRGLQKACYGVGQITGLAGVRHDEYRVIHGA